MPSFRCHNTNGPPLPQDQNLNYLQNAPLFTKSSVALSLKYASIEHAALLLLLRHASSPTALVKEHTVWPQNSDRRPRARRQGTHDHQWGIPSTYMRGGTRGAGKVELTCLFGLALVVITIVGGHDEEQRRVHHGAGGASTRIGACYCVPAAPQARTPPSDRC